MRDICMRDICKWSVNGPSDKVYLVRGATQVQTETIDRGRYTSSTPCPFKTGTTGEDPAYTRDRKPQKCPLKHTQRGGDKNSPKTQGVAPDVILHEQK